MPFPQRQVDTIVQRAMRLLKNTAVPDSVVQNSGVRIVDEMKELLSLVAADLRNKYDWVELKRIHTFTSTGDANYPLPVDFDSLVSNTVWSTSGLSPFAGPLTPQQWEGIQNGVAITGPPPQFRIFGSGNLGGPATKQFYVNPLPAIGDTLAYEYNTRTWILPATWETGMDYGSAGVWKSYGSNVYFANTSGTTGATPPTWYDTQSDGGVTWTYEPLYDRPVYGDDYPIFDEELLIWGLVYFYLANNKMDFTFSKKNYDDLARIRSSGKRGLSVIKMSQLYLDSPHFINYYNIPDTGYGG